MVPVLFFLMPATEVPETVQRAILMELLSTYSMSEVFCVTLKYTVFKGQDIMLETHIITDIRSIVGLFLV